MCSKPHLFELEKASYTYKYTVIRGTDSPLSSSSEAKGMNINMKIINEIKETIKSHKRLYKLIRPIELKYYAFKRRIIRAGNMAVLGLIKPAIRKKAWRKETKNLLKFHNIHKGKRIFVIATGPSLREEDVLKLKDEITMSVNGAVTLVDTIGWRPTYYFISDGRGWLKYKDKINNAGYKDVFVSINTMKEYEDEFSFVPHYYETYLNIKHIFDILLGKAYDKMKMEFSDDIYLKGVFGGGNSVVTGAVQFAAYMGASEIYLLGQDCDYSGPKHYFHNGTNKLVNSEGFASTMFAFYRVARQYCEAHNIKLYNATRGGRLEELERVDFDEVIE